MSTALMSAPRFPAGARRRPANAGVAADGARPGAGADARAAVTAPAPRLRLTRRGRAVITALLAIPLIVGGGVAAISGGAAAAGEHAGQTHFSTVTVRTGDSLWSVAERIAPHSDPRAVVSDLVSLNQLDGTMLTPGERLSVPAQYDAGGAR